GEEDDVALAIRSMPRKGVRRLPVMNSRVYERIRGMVTNKLVLRLLESCLAYNSPKVGIQVACKQPARSIMISRMPVIDPNEDCGTASYLMREFGTGGFAVADSRGLLGIITERDIVRRVYKREGISFFSELFLSRSQTLYA
ncbi:MAG: CBS domain-containing protein, partial [Nitrososphaerota archaeon]|nr:CBS domain-containing protein [Nitrososphaerota archaeon]